MTQARRAPRAALAAVAVLCVAAAVWIVVDAEPRTIARVDDVSAPVTVECGLTKVNQSTQWGEATTVLCGPVEDSHLLRAGTALTLAGAAGFGLAAMSGRRSRARRRAVWAGGVVLVIGVPGMAFGGLLGSTRDELTPLPQSVAASLDALTPLEPVDAFEVVEQRLVAGGLTTNEELWVLVDAPVEEVRASLASLRCSTVDAPPEFDEGWVDARVEGSLQAVEIGPAARALADGADVGQNARFLLRERAGDGGAISLVHLAPARFTEPPAPGGCPV